MRAQENQTLFTPGTEVVLTKLEIKEGCRSTIKVGSVRTGVLAETIGLQKVIVFRNRRTGKYPVTSSVWKIAPEQDNKMIAETVTSKYVVQIKNQY